VNRQLRQVYVCCRVKVNVSNGMSTTSSSLCPAIVVINPPAASAPVCRPTVSIVNATTLDSPLTSLRSVPVNIKASALMRVSHVCINIIVIIVVVVLLRLLAMINLVPLRAVNLQQEPRDVLGIVDQILVITTVYSQRMTRDFAV